MYGFWYNSIDHQVAIPDGALSYHSSVLVRLPYRAPVYFFLTFVAPYSDRTGLF
jgi:hypothetical protein